MPRKNYPAASSSGVRSVRCFNEAAARCRGKTRDRLALVRHRIPASMRPRPDAAEKPARERRSRPARPAASMRPRPDAAEKHRGFAVGASLAARFNEAAARCRGKTLTARLSDLPGANASMRPRPDAAEKRRVSPSSSCSPPCFNEAAARCRGKTARADPIMADRTALQ